MADIYSKQKRSQIMSRIKCSDTRPEQRMLFILREVLGHKWSIDCNRNDLPGRPDFLIPSLNLIIFVDGCFYHYCPSHGHIPKSNVTYWKTKIEKNQKRDRASRAALRKMGYSVWRFWEHDVKPTKQSKTTMILSRRLEKRIAVFRK